MFLKNRPGIGDIMFLVKDGLCGMGDDAEMHGQCD
jgi:hypothetical protein